MEMDLEDYLEEVKFQMTEYDILDEKRILGWEKQARKWVAAHKTNPRIHYRSGEDIWVTVKSEEDLEKTAEKFSQAVKKEQTEKYWKGNILW